MIDLFLEYAANSSVGAELSAAITNLMGSAGQGNADLVEMDVRLNETGRGEPTFSQDLAARLMAKVRADVDDHFPEDGDIDQFFDPQMIA